MILLLVLYVIAENIAATASNGDTDSRERNKPQPWEMMSLNVWSRNQLHKNIDVGLLLCF